MCRLNQDSQDINEKLTQMKVLYSYGMEVIVQLFFKLLMNMEEHPLTITVTEILLMIFTTVQRLLLFIGIPVIRAIFTIKLL